MTAAARKTEEESLYEELLSDGDLGVEPENDQARPQSTAELLEELGRIRGECGDFLRRYQQACGVRTTPRRPAPRQTTRGLDSAERRKAILHLLIEELITS
jgi:hypothetical protein